MSNTGVPSTISKPEKFRVSPFIESNLASVSPIGFGRCGLLVENTPVFKPFMRGGFTFALTPFLEFK
uniref:Uncharacterized protein n=1 Tax=Ciona intestinalis TaxID=7719 RepID=H2Y3G5_CIOIN